MVVRMASPRKTDLELATGSHKYKLLDGSVAINVTAISELIDDGKSSAMAYVAADLTRRQIDYKADWDATRDLGSEVHANLEKWMSGEAVDATDEMMPFLDGIEKWMVEDDPQMIEQECVVLSSLGYGGRPDWIGTINRWPGIGIIDYKAGKKYPIAHALQISAYSRADGIAVYDDDTGALTGLRPLPEIEWGADLYIRDDGTYSLDRYPIGDDVFEVFCGLLHAYRWTRTPEMKRLVALAKPYNKSVKEAREMQRGTQ